MKVVFLRADAPTLRNPPCSSAWLCGVPAKVLERHGIGARVRDSKGIHMDHPVIDWADVVVVERHTAVVTELMIEAWQQRGKRVLLRFDDAYSLLPTDHRSYIEVWGNNIRGLAAHDRLVQSLSLFDSYSTPSKLLTADYAEHGKGVHIPNRPDLLGFPHPLSGEGEKETLNLAWGGSIPHRQSWVNSGAAESINEIVGRHRHLFKLILLCEREWFPEVFKGVPYTCFPWVPIHRYRLRLRRFADVGLAPLAGEYDARRSWIKVLVYALLGIPWIASDEPPYQGCKGGLLVENTPEAWSRAIVAMLSYDNRRELRRQGLEWAWSQGLGDHIQEWVDWLGG